MASRQGLGRSRPVAPSAALAAGVIDAKTFTMERGLPQDSSLGPLRQEHDSAADGRTTKSPALPGEHPLVLKR